MAVAGNYTCLLRNDTHKMEHHVELIVKSKIRLLRHTAKETHWLTFPISADSPPETPLATFEPQSLQELQEGDLARFYCEAFVGNLNLPDEKSEISWHRLSRHGELQKLHSVEIVKRCVEELIRFPRPSVLTFIIFIVSGRTNKFWVLFSVWRICARRITGNTCVALKWRIHNIVWRWRPRCIFRRQSQRPFRIFTSSTQWERSWPRSSPSFSSSAWFFCDATAAGDTTSWIRCRTANKCTTLPR